ncbi:DUF2178 domain-containing protein [Candidatus Beckwithbacteria bacterium]|nr:DUF2178 domain-containing protein [Candidatus Beckwithbacteria bacterium]
MKLKTYKYLKLLIVAFISISISLSINLNNFILAFSSIILGIFILKFLQAKVKDILIDERAKMIAGQAAVNTYMITTSVLGFTSFVLMFFGRRGSYFLESLGYVLSYLTIFIIFVYVVLFKYFSKKYGD